VSGLVLIREEYLFLVEIQSGGGWFVEVKMYRLD